MKTVNVPRAAAAAVAPNVARPATATVYDSPDLRLVVFRLATGQSVPPHRNASTVMLNVISGQGFVGGGDEEHAVAVGDTVVFEPHELHGMRAESMELVLLAAITPRPGDRSRTAVETHNVARGTVSGAEEAL